MSRKIQILLILSLFAHMPASAASSPDRCRIVFVELDKPFLEKVEAELELNMQAILMSEKQAWIQVQELMLKNFDYKSISDYVSALSKVKGFETMPSINEALLAGAKTKEQIIEFIQMNEAFPNLKTLIVKATSFDSRFNLQTTGEGVRVLEAIEKARAENEKAKVDAEKQAKENLENEKLVEENLESREAEQRVQEANKVAVTNVKSLDKRLPNLHNDLLIALQAKNISEVQRRIVNEPEVHGKVFDIFADWFISNKIYQPELLKQGQDPYALAFNFLKNYLSTFSGRNTFWKEMYITMELAQEAGVFSKERISEFVSIAAKQVPVELLRDNGKTFEEQIMRRLENGKPVVYISEYILVDILNHLLDSKGINTIAKLNVAVAKLDYKEIIHHTEVIHKYFKSWDYKFPIQTFRFSILSEALLFYSNKNETIKENIEYVKALGKLDTLLILEQSVEAPGNGHIN